MVQVPSVRLLTKSEKAWFFPLCGYQPKINKLIFLVYLSDNILLFIAA